MTTPSGSITIRPLVSEDWELLREFRLGALKSSPGVFALSYDESASFPPERWQDSIKGPAHQIFGLLDGSDLIGITAVFSDKEDPTGKTALLAMSFILPSYRGRGLSRVLYDTRLDWIRAHPQFTRIVVSHRASNEVSQRANQRYGFVHVRTSSKTWPDGSVEDEVFYELNI
ncbi:hypothetical protein AYO42_00895 [Rhizomicrobium sp. SCGC AG-212-E05]|nr:hypothetical protein AYO42_00895 [Rhizomicrobium sp. SCGC AG-212-E05]